MPTDNQDPVSEYQKEIHAVEDAHLLGMLERIQPVRKCLDDPALAELAENLSKAGHIERIEALENKVEVLSEALRDLHDSVGFLERRVKAIESEHGHHHY